MSKQKLVMYPMDNEGPTHPKYGNSTPLDLNLWLSRWARLENRRIVDLHDGELAKQYDWAINE